MFKSLFFNIETKKGEIQAPSWTEAEIPLKD